MRIYPIVPYSFDPICMLAATDGKRWWWWWCLLYLTFPTQVNPEKNIKLEVDFLPMPLYCSLCHYSHVSIPLPGGPFSIDAAEECYHFSVSSFYYPHFIPVFFFSRTPKYVCSKGVYHVKLNQVLIPYKFIAVSSSSAPPSKVLRCASEYSIIKPSVSKHQLISVEK